jgi:plastocyanin
MQVHNIKIKSAMLNDAGEYVVKVGLAVTRGQLSVDEEATVFTKPLHDQAVTEFTEATFTCEVSKPNKVVTFYKDGKPIKAGDKYEIVVENCTHTLKIKDAQMEDAGKIEARVDEASCEATFTVNGQSEEYLLCK